MDREYDFKRIEKKWREKWENGKCFEVNLNQKQKKFYNLEMFPYPSGAGLHIGHALNYTIGDIRARFKRMSGFNVLYPMGYDSFGLPAENAAIKAGTHPRDYTKDSISNFIEQQKALGLSYDWSKILSSCEPKYYRWNQLFFLKFLENGLVYRKKTTVNWCSKCQTVLANEEVHNGKCWRHEDTEVEIKHLEQWFIKTTEYADELLKMVDELNWPERIKLMQKNWIGRSEGAELIFEIEKPEDKISNVIIVHGSNENKKSAQEGGVENTRHWHFWLKEELESREIVVSGELYPRDWDPDYNDWKKVFEKNKINEDSILIGHSAGATFLCRWLGETKKKIKKLILIAPYVRDDGKAQWLKNFVTFNLDENLNDYCGEIVIFYDKKDEKGIVNSVNFLNKNLICRLIQLKDRGHFVEKHMGTNEFPELLSEVLSKEKFPIFTTRPDTIYGVTFMVISAQHSRLMEFVTKEHKKEVESFLKKIKSVSEKDADKLNKEGVFTGSYVINPINGNKVPLWVGNFVVADYGSGMVMAVPAHDQRDFDFAKKYGIDIKPVITVRDPLDFKNLPKGDEAYTKSGILMNSREFDRLDNEVAKKEIVSSLRKKKLAREVVQFKMRDWLISRQRYWGTPIPVVYCDKCGIVPIPEKDLPIELPYDVKFGKGNPLLTNEKFVNCKCPKCNGKARRETDTMATFVDSSWYYMRYPDNENSKKPFDEKIENYWLPVDCYIGGAEHATMHLLYARFWTKALRDLGYVKFDEPFVQLFNQGMLHASDGKKMSKSLGNVLNPLDIINKEGADALRLTLISFASPDSDTNWDEKVLQGNGKFLKKIFEKIYLIKIGKSSAKIESKLNKTIKGISEDIESFRYNLAVIKLRDLFNSLSEEESKNVLEKSLQLLAPFCPHITEELWEKIGNKKIISLSKWPVVDEKKIDEKFEKEDEAVNKLVSDIVNISKFVEGKSKVYVYVLPNELDIYNDGVKDISKRVGKDVTIYSVSDKDKHDPENKSKNVKPGRPGIYLE